MDQDQGTKKNCGSNDLYINFVHASHIKHMVGHVAAAPGPKSVLAAALGPESVLT